VITHDRMREGLSRDASSLLVIDVREPHEHALSKNWKALGVSAPPRNVPLSRFANFMRERLADPAARVQGVVLMCSGGGRSLHAAKTLRRMGFDRAWSLEGGLALV
jgi:rhodanese-related sulfurtransferase